MQLLAYLHLLPTASFVLLLAFVLSKVFFSLATFVIGGRRRATPHGGVGSQKDSRSPTRYDHKVEQQMMTQVPEDEEEEGDDEDTEEERTAGFATAPKSVEVGAQIFDGVGRVEKVREDREEWREIEPHEDEVKHDSLGAGHGLDPGERIADQEDPTMYWDKSKQTEEECTTLEEHAEKIKIGSSVLADAQGSSSNRLPPTWSDLERIVNMSSKKLSPPSPSSSGPLIEDEL